VCVRAYRKFERVASCVRTDHVLVRACVRARARVCVHQMPAHVVAFMSRSDVGQSYSLK
jgi:hypothetical protein